MYVLLWQVYAIAFNNPFGNKVATGSFDKTARIWDVSTGDSCYQLRGAWQARIGQATVCITLSMLIHGV
jgi:WD40 repeat protein